MVSAKLRSSKCLYSLTCVQNVGTLPQLPQMELEHIVPFQNTSSNNFEIGSSFATNTPI